MKAFIDSDILIWHLRGELKASKFLHKLSQNNQYELWTGAMQMAEIVFFMRPKEELLTKQFLAKFKIAAINQKTVETAGKLFRKWNASHNIDVNDAILAAIA